MLVFIICWPLATLDSYNSGQPVRGWKKTVSSENTRDVK